MWAEDAVDFTVDEGRWWSKAGTLIRLRSVGPAIIFRR
jgi:hypothetical protein